MAAGPAEISGVGDEAISVDDLQVSIDCQLITESWTTIDTHSYCKGTVQLARAWTAGTVLWAHLLDRPAPEHFDFIRALQQF